MKELASAVGCLIGLTLLAMNLYGFWLCLANVAPHWGWFMTIVVGCVTAPIFPLISFCYGYFWLGLVLCYVPSLIIGMMKIQRDRVAASPF